MANFGKTLNSLGALSPGAVTSVTVARGRATPEASYDPELNAVSAAMS
jgi:hypothetical protein